MQLKLTASASTPEPEPVVEEVEAMTAKREIARATVTAIDERGAIGELGGCAGEASEAR